MDSRTLTQTGIDAIAAENERPQEALQHKKPSEARAAALHWPLHL